MRFIKTFREKIYENSTTYDSKSYLSYLNKLADEYNDSYHCNKSSYHLNLKLTIELGLLGTKVFLAKLTTKIG